LTALLVGAGCAPRPNGIVAVLTDYGTQDHYVGVLIANVLRANPHARIVTITHEIEPFNIAQGAFVLAEAGVEFPAGSVLLGIVDPGVGTERAPIVVVTAKGRILVGPDNGLLDPLIHRDGGARGVYRIANPALLRPGALSSTFHGRDLFAPIAGHLSRGVDPASVGPRLSEWVRLDLPEPVQAAGAMRGAVMHVDRYGNLLTNILADWLEALPMGAGVEVAAGQRQVMARYSRTYAEAPRGEFVALCNASGYVEIARNLESAAAQLNVHAGDPIELWPAGVKR
jgi:S-adenosylmethionine hydrolase